MTPLPLLPRQKEGYRAPQREQSATEQLRDIFARQQQQRRTEGTADAS